MTRQRTTAIATGLTGAAAVVGLVAVMLGIGGDVAVTRADVSRHDLALAAHDARVHALELGVVVLPAQLSALIDRVEDLTRRLESVERGRTGSPSP
jgi:hypothetical protein